MKSERINENLLKSQSGFTLVEMAVVIFVFAMISVGVIALVSSIITGSSEQARLLYASDQARKLSAVFAFELRNAQASNSGAYPLSSAEPGQIVFFSNIDGGGDVERVRYYSSGDKIFKGVVKPSGPPYIYDWGSEKIVQVQADFLSSSDLFYYYAGDYAGVIESYLTAPVDVTEVRHIKMRINLRNTAGMEKTNSYNVTAGATPRNLKDNLGE